jgi:hypothetical protein
MTMERVVLDLELVMRSNLERTQPNMAAMGSRCWTSARTAKRISSFIRKNMLVYPRLQLKSDQTGPTVAEILRSKARFIVFGTMPRRTV